MRRLYTALAILFALSLALATQQQRVKLPSYTDCATIANPTVGELCWDSDADADGDGTAEGQVMRLVDPDGDGTLTAAPAGDGADATSARLLDADSDGTQDIWLPKGSTLTIAAGAVTATHPYHAVDEETDGTADDLDTISGVSRVGSLLVITPLDTDATITLKDATGNLQLAGDAALNSLDDVVLLLWTGADLDADGTNDWLELTRSLK